MNFSYPPTYIVFSPILKKTDAAYTYIGLGTYSVYSSVDGDIVTPCSWLCLLSYTVLRYQKYNKCASIRQYEPWEDGIFVLYMNALLDGLFYILFLS
jgi:hypothetical protein